MHIQELFYSMGILFMTLAVLILIALGILFFYIKMKIDQLQKLLGNRWEEVRLTLVQPLKNVFIIREAILPMLPWLLFRKKKKK